MPRDEIKQYLDRSPPDVRHYVEQLEGRLASAVREIERLHGVVRDHVKCAANAVVERSVVTPITILDAGGLRTLVTVRPTEYSFYLSEPLGSWSREHREAFHRQVVREFSERSAEIIARSIWSAREPAT